MNSMRQKRTWGRWLLLGVAVLLVVGDVSSAFATPQPYLGIQVREVDSPMAQRLGIKASEGVLLAGVRPGSPAQQAGLKPGDVVVRFGPAPTPTCAALGAAVRQSTAGMSYRTEFHRGGRLLFVNVVPSTPPPPPPGGYPQTFSLGLRAVSADSPIAKRLGIESPQGTAITEVRPGSAAEQAGLRRGDLIVEFAGQPAETFEDYQALAFQCALGSRQPVTFVRLERRMTTMMTIAASPRYDAPWFYVHPQDAYRLELLPEWQAFSVEQSKTPTERQYDRVISIFAGYQLRCYKHVWTAVDSEAALDEFIRTQRRHAPQGHTGRSTFGGASAAWVAIPLENDPYLLYRIALVHRGRRYVIDAFAPVLSNPERLPLPIETTLQTLEFRAAKATAPPDGSGTSGVQEEQPTTKVPAQAPLSEVPEGWSTTTIDGLTISVPADWTRSELSATDEALWYKGGDLLSPEVSFRLVRDVPLGELIRGGKVTCGVSTPFGQGMADETVVEIPDEHRPEKGIVFLFRPADAGAIVALAGFAPTNAWEQYEPVFRQILACLRIESASAANDPP